MGILDFRGFILSELHETEGDYDENGDYVPGTEMGRYLPLRLPAREPRKPAVEYPRRG